MVYKFKENRVRRAYLGGKRIDSFVGKEKCEDGFCPEEWLASSVEAFNPDDPYIKNEGLSECENGVLFRDILNENTEKAFGKRLNDKYGGKASILVKLLDAAERLAIQCHPTVSFAKEHLNSNFGKTESWLFLDTTPDAFVYLGFKPEITRQRWIDCFERQDVNGMLECLHRIPVSKGDLWLVDGGVPHAIGPGCFLIELQEPSDLMVIPERVTPSGRKLSDVKLHCGLGFEKMFDCFAYQGTGLEELKRKYYRKLSFRDNSLVSVIDGSLTDKFSMKALRINYNARIDLGDAYAVCIVTEGEAILNTEGSSMLLKRGSSFFVCANSGELEFEGNADIILCLA